MERNVIMNTQSNFGDDLEIELHTGSLVDAIEVNGTRHGGTGSDKQGPISGRVFKINGKSSSAIDLIKFTTIKGEVSGGGNGG